MNQRIEDFESELLMEEALLLKTETDDSNTLTREEAIDMLMAEIQKGLDSVKSEDDWLTEEEVCQIFGVTLND